jgi:4-hydroxy-2-oxoheptanedioate aldolase
LNHPEVRAAVVDGIQRITRAGLPAGYLSMDDTLLREVEAAGATFIAIGLDAAFLRKAAITARAAWT